MTENAQMKVEMVSVGKIKPYEKNPRINESAVDAVAASIKEFGFRVPLVIDKAGVIVCGHTRWKAAKKLGIKTVPCVTTDDMTPAQIKAFRIADNQTSSLADWDIAILDSEIKELEGMDFDIDLLGFKEGELDALLSGDVASEGDGSSDENNYSRKVESPVYEPKNEKPAIGDMINLEKYHSLCKEIDESDIPEDVKEFLKLAATRHIVFTYSKVADFYAHSEKPVQELMENSALVIIDFNKAIELGFVKLTDEIAEQYKSEYGEYE